MPEMEEVNIPQMKMYASRSDSIFSSLSSDYKEDIDEMYESAGSGSS
jgi:uncharacterized protein YihD (DUF1040 family)